MRNNKLGYYQVGLEYFEHKVPALLRATETGLHPKWNFNKELFDSVNWKQEPHESLWELYIKRAQQLREKYDYLILGYSGGSDSKNILDVFLQNGIKIDEIVSKFSIKGMGKDYIPTKENLNYDFNMPAEWEFTAKKDFQWLAEHHPEIKLTFYDWFENPNLMLADDWYKDRNFMFCPFVEQRHGIDMIDSIYKHNNVGYILGIDKPKVIIRDNKYYLIFLDVVAYGMTPERTVVGNATIEYFYWAPEAEAVLRKQAHMIKKYFEQHPQLNEYMLWPPKAGIPRDPYENIVRSLIYPTWEIDRFQCAKSTDSIVSTDRGILEERPELKKKHTEGMNKLRSMINTRFHSANGNFVGMISPFYEL